MGTFMKAFSVVDEQASGISDRPIPECQKCHLSATCLPEVVGRSDAGLLSILVHTNRTYRPGDYLYREGDGFQKLFIVKSGSVKTTSISGVSMISEQVLRFHLPGDALGLDAVAGMCHPTSAVALEKTVCCEIPFVRLEQMASTHPQLQGYLYSLLSGAVIQTNAAMALLGLFNATQRVTAFMLDMSRRLERQGLCETVFRMSMSRAEIASHLGLATETVSRTLARLHDEGLIMAEGKNIALLDLPGLEAILTVHGRE